MSTLTTLSGDEPVTPEEIEVSVKKPSLLKPLALIIAGIITLKLLT